MTKVQPGDYGYNMKPPLIPSHPGMASADARALSCEIIEELNTIIGRRHGSRSTYSIGCRGPLCRKAERDRGRGKYRIRQTAAGAEVYLMPPRAARVEDPFLEYHQEYYDVRRNALLEEKRAKMTRRRKVSA